MKLSQTGPSLPSSLPTRDPGCPVGTRLTPGRAPGAGRNGGGGQVQPKQGLSSPPSSHRPVMSMEADARPQFPHE